MKPITIITFFRVTILAIATLVLLLALTSLFVGSQAPLLDIAVATLALITMMTLSASKTSIVEA